MIFNMQTNDAVAIVSIIGVVVVGVLGKQILNICVFLLEHPVQRVNLLS